MAQQTDLMKKEACFKSKKPEHRDGGQRAGQILPTRREHTAEEKDFYEMLRFEGILRGSGTIESTSVSSIILQW